MWTGGENLAPTGIRYPDRPARSQSIYRLSYPAHKHSDKGLKKKLWREVCDDKDGNAGHCGGNQQYGVSVTVCAVFYRNDFFTTGKMFFCNSIRSVMII